MKPRMVGYTTPALKRVTSYSVIEDNESSVEAALMTRYKDLNVFSIRIVGKRTESRSVACWYVIRNSLFVYLLNTNAVNTKEWEDVFTAARILATEYSRQDLSITLVIKAPVYKVGSLKDKLLKSLGFIPTNAITKDSYALCVMGRDLFYSVGVSADQDLVFSVLGVQHQKSYSYKG